MHIFSTAAIATVAAASLSVWSFSSATTVGASESGVCGLTVTCVERNETAAACSANATADFTLVSRSLQSCKDVSYYFSQGQPWPINDKALFCKVDSVCGKLVPYLRNTAYLRGVPCADFAPFADTIATFRDYCAGEPVQQLAGDNGLLRELKLGNGTARPTPAPTNFDDYRSVPAPADANARTSSAPTAAVAPASLWLTTAGVVAAVVTIAP